MAAGYTMSLPAEDKRMNFRREYIDRMAMMLGGYAAEKEIFGDITTGASNDLQKTTQTAKRLVTRFGMSDLLGPRTYGEQEEMIFLGREIHEQRDYSEETATKIDAEIYRLVTDALETARKIIREHRDRLDLVVKHLLEKEIIEKEEFEKIVGPVVKAPKLEILGGSV
jgi:cell division protease FtsH